MNSVTGYRRALNSVVWLAAMALLVPFGFGALGHPEETVISIGLLAVCWLSIDWILRRKIG